MKPGEAIENHTRTVVLAGVGVTFIFALALFIASFVAPLVHTNGVLREFDSTLRMDGAAVVEKLGGPRRAVNRLTSYLQLPRWLAPHRESAARCLGHCDETAVPHLVRAIRNEDPLIRAAATYALHEFGPSAEAVVPALRQAIDDETPGVRAAAIHALGRIGPAGLAALTEALSHEEWDVRLAAAKELGQLGPAARAAVPALERAVENEKDEDIRAAVAEALRRIQREPRAAEMQD